MEFTSQTIATMVQDVADKCDPDSAFKLHAIVRALEGKDINHRLELKQVKPGKFVSPTEQRKQFLQIMEWLETLTDFEDRAIKKEAAIATIAEQSGFSRATVFAGIKRAKELQEVMHSAIPGFRFFRGSSKQKPD